MYADVENHLMYFTVIPSPSNPLTHEYIVDLNSGTNKNSTTSTNMKIERKIKT